MIAPLSTVSILDCMFLATLPQQSRNRTLSMVRSSTKTGKQSTTHRSGSVGAACARSAIFIQTSPRAGRQPAISEVLGEFGLSAKTVFEDHSPHVNLFAKLGRINIRCPVHDQNTPGLPFEITQFKFRPHRRISCLTFAPTPKQKRDRNA